MAAFSRKPLRCAKLFHFFDDEHFDWLAIAQPMDFSAVRREIFAAENHHGKGKLRRNDIAGNMPLLRN